MNTRTLDHLIERLRSVAAALPDVAHRGQYTRCGIADIALAAFAVFFTPCPSFLSYQRAMARAGGRNNDRSLFQVERIPSDNHIRQTLDPVAPHHLLSLFDELHRALDRAGLLEEMRAVHPTGLIALDATWYFFSQSKNICCPNCSCIEHAEGKTTHFHSAITPLLVSPGHGQVVPLRPELITPQDGQAGLRNHRRQTLAGRPRRALCHRQRHLAGRGSLRPSALLPVGVAARVSFSFHLEARFTCLAPPMGGSISTGASVAHFEAAGQRPLQPLGAPPVSQEPNKVYCART